MTEQRAGRALVVGVSQYAFFPNLPDAVRADVEDISALLGDPTVCRLRRDAIWTLLDGAATANALRRELQDMVAVSREEELFLFYFSGHGHRSVVGGVEHTWLLTHDADPSALDRTAIRSDELRDILAPIVSRRQVLIFDACHSGGFGAAKSTMVQPSGFGKSGLDALAAGAGRALLSSSRADEESVILTAARNSVFTTALIEGLHGSAAARDDGLVGVLDVFDYVSRTVPERANQHPVLRTDNLEGNFPLALRPIAPCGAERTPTVAEITKAMARLYPMGPLQDQVWSRAGGDVARLTLNGSGIGQWHAAIAKAVLGGGGTSMRRLLEVAAEDFPANGDVAALLAADVALPGA